MCVVSGKYQRVCVPMCVYLCVYLCVIEERDVSEGGGGEVREVGRHVSEGDIHS